jgi:hypothetical protein
MLHLIYHLHYAVLQRQTGIGEPVSHGKLPAFELVWVLDLPDELCYPGFLR